MVIEFTPEEMRFDTTGLSESQIIAHAKELAMQLIHRGLRRHGSHTSHEWNKCNALRGYLSPAVEQVEQSILKIARSNLHSGNAWESQNERP